VDVAPLGSAIAQFNWHTPILEPGQETKHYCLQASLYHPMDTNTDNNTGQENTNVYRSENPGFVTPGQQFTVDVPLFNYSEKLQNFQFDVTAYKVNMEDQFELVLKTTRGYSRWSLSQRLANYLPSLHVRQSLIDETARVKATKQIIKPFDFHYQSQIKAAKNKYIGFDKIRETILSRDYSLPAGMVVTANNEPLDKGIEIAEREVKVVQFAIKVPDDAPPNSITPLNIIAFSFNGVMAGGVTVLIHVKEDN
jgi:hypothetical protein